MMTYITNITVEIGRLEKWQRVALAAMCTTSLSPLVVRFAQPATRRAFEQGLDAAWTSAHDGTPDPRAVYGRGTLDSLPETACDDSNMPAYEVMRALGALACALDAVIEDESERPTIDACTNATEVYSGYDYVLDYGNQPRMIDPRNPPPPGRLESLHIQSQLDSIEKMRTAGQLGDPGLEQMRAFGNQLATELDRAIPAYGERRGWKL